MGAGSGHLIQNSKERLGVEASERTSDSKKRHSRRKALGHLRVGPGPGI